MVVGQGWKGSRMTLLSLILREWRHHWINALLSTVGLTIAVALLVALRMTTGAAERETRRVMRDLGFNLRIIPKTTDMDYFWTHGFSDQTMPESTVRTLADQSGIFVTFNHLTPALEGRVALAGASAILTGLGETIVSPHEGRQPMGFRIKPGEAFLGHSVAQRLQVKKGDTFELAGKKLRVEKALSESGTDEDLRIFTSLRDAQAVLQSPHRINEIKAIDCLCLTADQDPLSKLRQVIETALPEAKVLQLRTLADARARQRQMAEKMAAYATPLALSFGGTWVGLLAWLNVRERRAEIGLWRALGHGSGRLAGLLLGKAVLLGLLGAAAGFALGTGLALAAGPSLFQVTAKSLQADPQLLWKALAWTPLFAAIASLPPALKALADDPALSLRAD